MKFLEKDLEDIIFETENYKLFDRGLDSIGGRKLRQVNIGNYGIADIITYEKINLPFERNFLKISVFELKKEIINTSTFLQTLRYCKGISQYLRKIRGFYNFSLEINLIGRIVDKDDDIIYLSDLIGSIDGDYIEGVINKVNFYEYDYKYDGIHFKLLDGYQLSNEGF